MMNKSFGLIALPLLIAALAAQAQTPGERTNRAGFNGSISAGGDIGQSEGGYGFQGEFGVNQNFGVELAISTFSDEYSVQGVKINQDLTSIGLSGVYRVPLANQLKGYFLLGLDYNMPSADMTVDSWYWGRGWAGTVSLDDSFGGHLGAGLNLRVASQVEVFLEYRYTMVDMSGSMTLYNNGTGFYSNIDGSYNFGLFKLGVNVLF